MTFPKHSILVILAITSAIAVFLLFQGHPQRQSSVNKTPIVLGAIYSLTGFATPHGETEQIVTDYAVQEINKSGGINGRKIRIIYEDGKCSGKEALMAAKKLIEIDRVRIILGTTCSSETLSVAPYAKERGVLLFASIAGSSLISQYANVFRNTIPSSINGRKLGELLSGKKFDRIAILTENNDFPLDQRKGLIEVLNPTRKVVFDETYTLDQTDFKTEIAKLKNVKPDAIVILPLTGSTGGAFVKQMKEQKFEIPTFSAESPGANDFLATAGIAADGIVYTDIPLINETNQKLQELLKYFQSKGKTPIGPYFVAARYDSIKILKDALENCGEDNECIAKHIRSKTHHGLLGNYSFDQNGDVVGLAVSLKQIMNGKPVLYQE